jgi:4-alpha-glucanotransferase
VNELLNKRRAGVLLHITSLPGEGITGDLGSDAYRFVDFLHHTGVTVWQTLPLGVTHADGSPYQCLSAHAGNPDLINIDWLVAKNWLLVEEKCLECEGTAKFNKSCLISKAFAGFLQRADKHDKELFDNFCEQKAFWLDDFALFMTLRNEFEQQCWNQWPDGYKERDSKTLKVFIKRLEHAIATIKFEQFVFFQQWMALKSYANQRGILLFGDIPIFVSYDSADVWANPQVFRLDTQTGNPLEVAGVPPDYFSETGQLWGNPLYNWDYLKNTGFDWWVRRLKGVLSLVDIIRIDHFRGLEAYWAVAFGQENAINGHWLKAPGYDLFNTIGARLGKLPIIAEDLGDIDHIEKNFNEKFKFELDGRDI